MTPWQADAISREVLYCMDKVSLKKALLDVERIVIIRALKMTNGNCDHAARMLGMNRTTLVSKRRRFGLLKRKGSA